MGNDVDVDMTWIVVAHRSGDDLEVSLPSLRGAFDELARRTGFVVSLVVADAGSPDDTPDVARRLGARLHVEPDNRGYGATANAVAADVTSPWLAVSNADIAVPDGGLAALPDVLASLDPRVGLVGPRVLRPDGRPDAWSGGPAPTLARLVVGALAGVPQDEAHVEWLTGACLFARRAAWRAVGGFDERYFLYYEDVDLALRMREVGWVARRATRLAIVHRAPHHGRTPDPGLERVIAASRARYFRRHRPRIESFGLALVLPLRGLVDRSAPFVHDMRGG